MEAGLSSGSTVFENTAPPAVARPTLPPAASHLSILLQTVTSCAFQVGLWGLNTQKSSPTLWCSPKLDSLRLRDSLQELGDDLLW